MSKVGVSLKINVSEIEKGRLFTGKKGKYLDATVFIDLDEKDQFDNNGMITQDVTKEEKGNGIKGAILGNCKVFWRGESQQAPQTKPQQQQQKAPANNEFDDNFDDDIPF
jgi:single-stranded DNA-binding protein